MVCVVAQIVHAEIHPFTLSLAYIFLNTLVVSLLNPTLAVHQQVYDSHGALQVYKWFYDYVDILTGELSSI